MLTTEAQNLKTLVANYRAASSEKTQLQKLRQRAQELDSLRTRIHNQRLSNDLLKRRRMATDAVPPLAENILNIVSKLSSLASTPGALGGNEAAPHFNQLKKSESISLQQMESAILSMWQTFVDEQGGKYDIGVLADWEHVADFRVVARTIRTIQSKLTDLRSRIPTDEEDFARVETLSEKLKEAWKEIENTPPKVLKFLRDASSAAGAPLTRLDDEVFDWIRQRKLEGSFKVRTATDNPNAR